jgi:hypothetical protein
MENLYDEAMQSLEMWRGTGIVVSSIAKTSSGGEHRIPPSSCVQLFFTVKIAPNEEGAHEQYQNELLGLVSIVFYT